MIIITIGLINNLRIFCVNSTISTNMSSYVFMPTIYLACLLVCLLPKIILILLEFRDAFVVRYKKPLLGLPPTCLPLLIMHLYAEGVA